jgi:hypothetical protein
MLCGTRQDRLMVAFRFTRSGFVFALFPSGFEARSGFVFALFAIRRRGRRGPPQSLRIFLAMPRSGFVFAFKIGSIVIDGN